MAKQTESINGDALIQYVLKAAGKLGGAFTMLIIVFLFFIYYGTKEQHTEFIDRFILLKTENNLGPIIVIVGLIVLLALEGILFTWKLAALTNRINQLEHLNEELLKKIPRANQPKRNQ